VIEMTSLARTFDVSFFAGLALVVVAVAVAARAVTGGALPIVGSARGALIAVAIIGMAGCAVAGISQATTLGWGHPLIVVGSALGAVALAVIAAGIFGWDGILRPAAALVPGGVLAAATTEQLALVAIAAMIVAKFLINLGFAVTRAFV
jgi:hypothetical protein